VGVLAPSFGLKKSWAGWAGWAGWGGHIGYWCFYFVGGLLAEAGANGNDGGSF